MHSQACWLRRIPQKTPILATWYNGSFIICYIIMEYSLQTAVIYTSSWSFLHFWITLCCCGCSHMYTLKILLPYTVCSQVSLLLQWMISLYTWHCKRVTNNCCCYHKDCPMLIPGLLFIICSGWKPIHTHLVLFAFIIVKRYTVIIYNPVIQCHQEENGCSLTSDLLMRD